jgi:hypothetical protein
MGDRCYFRVWVRSVDAASEEGAKILADSGLEKEDRAGNLEVWVDDQMNYGGCDFLEHWSEAGFACEGYQEGGDDYSPSSFFSREGALFEVDTAKGWVVSSSERFVIDFDRETGEPSVDDLAAVKAFILGCQENEKEMRRGPLERLAAALDEPEK